MKRLFSIFLIILLLTSFQIHQDISAQIEATNAKICSIIEQNSTISAYYKMPNIDLKNYSVAQDKGTMTEIEYETFLNILAAAAKNESTVPYESDVSMEKILTHLELYYGTEKDFYKLFGWTDTHIILDLEVFEACAQSKALVEARVDEMLLTLKEGSDEFKLFQIAAYLAERIVYTDGARESIEGLNGNGVCSTYALLFYKAASRLGIQTYVCYGYTSGGSHAWNMVELEEKQYFYDITWFDAKTYNFQYLHNLTSWDREFTLNNAWWDIKQ